MKIALVLYGIGFLTSLADTLTVSSEPSHFADCWAFCGRVCCRRNCVDGKCREKDIINSSTQV